MTSVWLDVPLADYEGDMALPAVGQAQLISRLLAALHLFTAGSDPSTVYWRQSVPISEAF